MGSMLGASENLMTSQDSSKHFQFYRNIVQNACEISSEKTNQ